jgi:anti-sigma-K factor RskA
MGRLDELQQARSSLALWRSGAMVVIGVLVVAVVMLLILLVRR